MAPMKVSALTARRFEALEATSLGGLTRFAKGNWTTARAGCVQAPKRARTSDTFILNEGWRKRCKRVTAEKVVCAEKRHQEREGEGAPSQPLCVYMNGQSYGCGKAAEGFSVPKGT